jgi:hypothetical protein
VKNQLLKTGAAVVGAFMLVAASISGGGVVAQDATPTAATGAGSGPMSMTGACTTGLAASMLSQAQMMMTTPMATTDPAMATPAATTDAAMTTPTTEATMDMSTPTEAATTEGGTGAAITEPWCFVVFLSGAAEKPDMGDPDGYGIAAISVDPTTNVVTFDVAVAGITLPATMTHIHKGAIDAGGDVVVPANGAPDANGMQMSTSDAADPALIQDILAHPEGYYFNVHTDDFPKGALRGQLSLGNMAGMGAGGEMMPTADMSGTMMAPTATP